MQLLVVEVAADIRRRAGEVRPAFSTMRLIEACFPSALVTGGRLPPGIDEMVSRRPEGPVIVYSRSLPGPAQRFAIAHALGHLLLDGEHVAARAGRAGLPEIEARADLFATELLAPRAIVADFVTRRPSDDPEEHEIYLDHVDEIASRFAVPAEIIDKQIKAL